MSERNMELIYVIGSAKAVREMAQKEHKELWHYYNLRSCASSMEKLSASCIEVISEI